MTLANGTQSWDQNAINAANDWNAVGAAFQFNVSVGGQFNQPCGPVGPGHACPNTGPVGDNPIVFSDNFCGVPFGPDIIELTNNCWDPDGGMINAPVFVNSAVPWNAYDGAIQCCTVVNGVPEPINDIRRVLVHEFGHVLGLGHPDQNGQTVTAIMNSRESDLYRLQPDDIAGIRAIYPGGNAATAPAANTGCRITTARSSGIFLLLLPAIVLWRRFRAARAEVKSSAVSPLSRNQG